MNGGSPGAVVNIASQAGIVGIEERAAYGTSKAGLIHLTKILALEWAPAGIRVNAVAPTFVRTELPRAPSAGPIGPQSCCQGSRSAGSVNRRTSLAPSHSFLLSDAAAPITGHTIAINGGYTIR